MVLQDERKNAWKTVIFFCVIMLTLCVADLIQEDVFFSESENRILAEKPEFSVESFFSGEFSEKYEEYLNDQFVSRNNWITLKTEIDRLLQKKEIVLLKLIEKYMNLIKIKQQNCIQNIKQ